LSSNFNISELIITALSRWKQVKTGLVGDAIGKYKQNQGPETADPTSLVRLTSGEKNNLFVC